MPVKMESFFLKPLTTFAKKAQAYMFERFLNRPRQLYLFHAWLLKKREDKPYQSVQIFFSEKTLRETYPRFPATLTKTNEFENIFTYQKFL